MLSAQTAGSQGDYCTTCADGRKRNHGGAPSRGRISAIGRGKYFRALWSKGGTISRIRDCHNSGSAGRPVLQANCVPRPRQRQWKFAPHRCCAGMASPPFARRASDREACPFCQMRLTPTITKLRFPIRKTRPSVKTVITLGLRKNAPDENRCREGDAYPAQIRQSRCHCAGISFV